MEVAKHHVNEMNETICPCMDCLNKRWQPLHVTRVHLLHRGMSIGYLKWTDHGEHRDTLAGEIDEQNEICDLFPHMNAKNHQAIKDEDDPMIDIDESEDDDDYEDEVMRDVIHLGGGGIEYNSSYEKLLLEAQCELYPGCKEHTMLSFVVELLQQKVENQWTNESVNKLLK
ncbi:hypothetical protein ACLB2K_025567 [Fragaria x ananassa]